MRLKHPPTALPASPSPLFQLYADIQRLKDLYRQGWLKRGLPENQAESVAEHIFSMSMLAWAVCAEFNLPLDPQRVVALVLVHELGEIEIGDITPADGVPPEEKHRLERAAVERVTRRLAVGPLWLALWEEFEAGQTPEARLARQLDRLDMAGQAAIYARRGALNPAEFFNSAAAALSDPALGSLLDEFTSSAAE